MKQKISLFLLSIFIFSAIQPVFAGDYNQYTIHVYNNSKKDFHIKRISSNCATFDGSTIYGKDSSNYNSDQTFIIITDKTGGTSCQLESSTIVLSFAESDNSKQSQIQFHKPLGADPSPLKIITNGLKATVNGWDQITIPCQLIPYGACI